MSTDRSTLQTFFERYGSALAGGDLSGISGCYAYPSYVPGDDVSVVITAASEIEAFFTGAAEGYHAAGMTRAVPALGEIDPLSPALLEVDVRWSYTDDVGVEHQSDRFRYLVRRHGERVHICVVTAIADG